MSFHRATFRLLGREPETTAGARAEVDDAERRLGVPIPASVRDWYERGEAVAILAEHSNNDPPIAVADFALVRRASETLLPIRYENQGVCTWAICLDGSDDPPVFVDVDTGGAEWQVQTQSFSDYVYSCVWDYRVVFQQPAVVQAQNDPLSAVAVETLTGKFRQQLRTHGWPGSTQYRFQGDRQGILIWAGQEQADWFIAASDAESLRAALEAVWDIDSVGHCLYDCSEIGRTVLAEMRAQPGRSPDPPGG
ncbi:MAG: SMI1/KNR4 family protein [Phycisphaerae bacterium]|nr:SMI1/KNR4 family protein [Phycisphaerae bacterium]